MTWWGFNPAAISRQLLAVRCRLYGGSSLLLLALSLQGPEDGVEYILGTVYRIIEVDSY